MATPRRKSRSGSRPRKAAVRPAAPAPATAVRLPRIAKGRRPVFYDDPAIDQLFAIVTALTGEISVLYDRLDTLQRLLDAGGIVPARALAGHVPDAAVAAARAAERDELLRRVFAVLEVYAAAAGKAAPAS